MEEDLERKIAELEDENRFMRAQLAGVGDPVFTWRRAGDDFVLAGMNEAAGSFWGARAMLGRSVRDMARYERRGETMPDILECLVEAYEGRKDIEREVCFDMDIPGRPRVRLWYYSRYSFIAPDLVVVHTRDLTAAKMVEQELAKHRGHLEELVRQRTAQLVDANAKLQEELAEREVAERRRRDLEARIQHAQKLESLGVLAGGIAHDFNNLLMGILGNADLALVRLAPASPINGHLQNIATTARRAADLTRQMLAYSGRGQFALCELDLREVVREIAGLLKVTLSKKVILIFDFADEIPVVEGDATQLRQIVMNLISNASDAMGDREGAIRVSVGSMWCDRACLSDSYIDEKLPEGDYVFLDVVDTGCGMDDQTRHRVFDPFFTTKFTGRGLGMASALGIIRGHRGAIKIASRVGEGTTIRVLLPALGRQAAATLEAPEEEEGGRGEGLVLVVDDEESVLTVLADMLEAVGFTPVTASNGREAVRRFEERPAEYRAILLDLTMPRMDGKETFAELRRIRSDVPVVLISGYDEQDVAARFPRDEVSGFIQKPFNQAALIRAILRAAGDGAKG
jgi:signal transduction histidine kinase/ActR/RegA family two-component response regulator